ncbi:hypothetical protein [Pseudomonas sp. BP8]|nr:hypothetical protein [Pseudomonas sp. BP8]MBP2261330.1 hypothetical protein [Pseudomonas sp. BP8]
MSREEARISTTPATIEDNASPDATRNFAISGGLALSPEAMQIL